MYPHIYTNVSGVLKKQLNIFQEDDNKRYLLYNDVLKIDVIKSVRKL